MHAGVLHNTGFLSNWAPPKRERQPESSVEGDRIAVGVGGSEGGKDGYQMGRRFQRGLLLHVSEVRSPLHPHFAIRPQLSVRPLDRIVTIFLLVSAWISYV